MKPKGFMPPPKLRASDRTLSVYRFNLTMIICVDKLVK
jgi:hypothetical protein